MFKKTTNENLCKLVIFSLFMYVTKPYLTYMTDLSLVVFFQSYFLHHKEQLHIIYDNPCYN